jgi:uncharacterized protein (DUF1810 family)
LARWRFRKTRSAREHDAPAFDLERFLLAQEADYMVALAELRSGRKRSHWMWYIFPQYRGLGSSSITRRYAMGSLDEARAFLQHPVLGPRLLECARVLLAHPDLSAKAILGSPDDLKLRSCATLFAQDQHRGRCSRSSWGGSGRVSRTRQHSTCCMGQPDSKPGRGGVHRSG